MLSVDAMKYFFFLIDVSTTDFKGKETAVKPNELFFLMMSNKSLKRFLL